MYGSSVPKNYPCPLGYTFTQKAISGSNSEYFDMEEKRSWEDLQCGRMKVGFSERCESDS